MICLQETKVPDELFPDGVPAELGYPHVVRRGMKGYNGVAILSRIPLEAARPDAPDWCEKGDCRHAAATLADPGRPGRAARFLRAGRRRRPRPGAQPEIRPQARLRRRGDQLVRRPAGRERGILVGDLNIAPLEHDVWSHKQLLNVVSHTPIEVEHLNAWLRDRLCRCDAPFRAGRREALYVVVVSQPGLAALATAAGGWTMSG